MMGHSPKPPEALMRVVAQDLTPVRPSPEPLQLALRMIPLALLVSSLILLAIGPRHDLSVLGPLLTWGASAAQFVLAIAFVWIAARKHAGGQAAEANRLFRGSRGISARCVCHAANFLDKSCERTSPACPATGQRNAA
jgi:hypothetical protein